MVKPDRNLSTTNRMWTELASNTCALQLTKWHWGRFLSGFTLYVSFLDVYEY